jgi:2-keto-4-pentenoate hydratase
MGAALLFNPLAAAYWFVDKMVRNGVDKTINK